MKKGLGETLRLIRIANDMSIKEIAEYTRISASYISEIERGTKKPRFPTLGKYTDAFHISFYDLFSLDEECLVLEYNYQKCLMIVLRKFILISENPNIESV